MTMQEMAALIGVNMPESEEEAEAITQDCITYWTKHNKIMPMMQMELNES